MSDETPRVLIVDDESIICTLLTLALEETGWVLRTACSAEEAMAAVEEAPFDLYLLDKNLPGMSGVELVRWIRQRDRIAGIVMMTAYASVQSALDTLHDGIDGYLLKPFEEIGDVVVEAITALGRSHARRAATEPEPRRRALTVLAASPRSEVSRWIVEMLRDGPTQIQTARDSREAVARVESEPPELLFLDARLDDPDVCKLIGFLEETILGAAFVVFDESPVLDNVVRYIDLGVSAVLEKHLDPAEFGKKVGPLLGELRGD